MCAGSVGWLLPDSTVDPEGGLGPPESLPAEIPGPEAPFPVVPLALADAVSGGCSSPAPTVAISCSGVLVGCGEPAFPDAPRVLVVVSAGVTPPAPVVPEVLEAELEPPPERVGPGSPLATVVVVPAAAPVLLVVAVALPDGETAPPGSAPADAVPELPLGPLGAVVSPVIVSPPAPAVLGGRTVGPGSPLLTVVVVPWPAAAAEVLVVVAAECPANSGGAAAVPVGRPAGTSGFGRADAVPAPSGSPPLGCEVLYSRLGPPGDAFVDCLGERHTEQRVGSETHACKYSVREVDACSGHRIRADS